MAMKWTSAFVIKFFCLLVNMHVSILNNYSTSTRWIWDGRWPTRRISGFYKREWKFFLLKMLTKYREFFSTLFVTDFHDQLAFNFEQTPTVIVFEEHGIMAHIP